MGIKPTTQYTKSGRINIAYQVFGSGPVDLVYIPGWVSNIDLMWCCPELVNFLQELGKVARVILFDKRGTGLSDRVVALSTLEERMDDIRAVMDAVGSQKAVLFGHSEGGSVSALFAATYPNRTISLIAFGIFAKRRYAPDYPWAPTDEERQAVYDMIEKHWGSGNMNLESLAPSKAHNKTFMNWLANYFRSGASPGAALLLTKMNTHVDIIDILGSIRVPTLLMQRTHDIDVKIEEGRFIAERIPGAKFVEFPGSDHLFWAGNTEEILTEIKAFMTPVWPQKNYVERLFTVVAARIIAPPGPRPDISGIVDRHVVQYRGRVVHYTPNTFIAIFDGPSKAIHCSMDLIDAVKHLNLQLATGIHIREGMVDGTRFIFITDETEDFVERMLQLARPNQILLTQTVKNLLSGAGLKFTRYKPVSNTSPKEILLLYSVTDPMRPNGSIDNVDFRKLPKNSSFLENVLQSIDAHLSDECFSVETLCREVGVSERQLQRKLKAITNKSPNQLIASVRLYRAKELLLEHRHNIAEIACKTGFANPSYFAKRFKKEFGISPSTLLQQQE